MPKKDAFAKDAESLSAEEFIGGILGPLSNGGVTEAYHRMANLLYAIEFLNRCWELDAVDGFN